MVYLAQQIGIFFNFVGKVDTPHEKVELTEEEKTALAELERRRQVEMRLMCPQV